jgi:hypothetical protein
MPFPARAAAAFLLVIFLLPTPGAAQRRSRALPFVGPVNIGPRVGRDFENHAWSLGGQVGLRLGQSLELRPSGDLFFPSHGDDGWQLNGDAALHFGQSSDIYAGAGIAYAKLAGADPDTGYNLFFGVSTAEPRAAWKPFLEFRWSFIYDTSPFRLALGVNYGL